MSTTKYRETLKPRIENEEVQYPDGTILSEAEEGPKNKFVPEEDSHVLQSEPLPSLVGATDSAEARGSQQAGWLDDSALDLEQQKKLFRLMGGKPSEDTSLLNKRKPNLDYRQIEQDLQAQWEQGINKKRGKQLQGLGKR